MRATSPEPTARQRRASTPSLYSPAPSSPAPSSPARSTAALTAGLAIALAAALLTLPAPLGLARAAAAAEIPPPADLTEPPADAERSETGLVSKVLEPGDGVHQPPPDALVRVHNTGWTASDGEMFDSSVARGEPAVLPLDRVITGWTEGLQLMVEGEKRRLWIPGELAYGDREDRPRGTLVFDVELLELLSAPAAPTNVAEPPANAERSESELAWVVLRPGDGGTSPGPDSAVEVRYTGWTTNGAMFDSSLPQGAPATFRLDKVIDGWTEGLQLMTPGEVRRFWIPKNLAYRGQPELPYGMLVFDIELVKVLGGE